MKWIGNILTIGLLVLALACPCVSVAQQSQEQMAAFFFDKGEYQQAAQLYESLYKRTTNRFYYQRLYDTYLRLEEYKEASHLAEKRLKEHPAELRLHVDVGNVYWVQKQARKAEKHFDKAIAAITANLAPIPDLAMAFLNAGRPDYAVLTYLAAREKTKNEQLYFIELVGVYQTMGDYAAMTNEYFNLLDKSPQLISSVQVNMQKAMLEAPDSRLSEGVKSALVQRVREHPDNKVYLEMMIWFAIQQKDFAFALAQAQAVDARFPDLGGEQLLRVARIAFQNDDLDVASRAFRLLQAKGKDHPRYFESRLGELEVEFARINHNYSIESKEYQTLRRRYSDALDELGRNERTVPLMRHFATLLAYHGSEVQAAVDLLDDVLALPRLTPSVRDEVKLELADLLLFAGSVWDASLLYMQVEKANKNDILGAQAKFKNAKLSYYNHDFDWANSQLKVLRSSTSKLIANDAMELSLLISDNMEDDSTYTMLERFADADLLFYRNQLDSAWDGFDAVSRAVLSHPLFDEVLMRKAQIRIKQARFADADSLLQRLVDLYPFDITADDALMLMAEINEERLFNPDKARQCYEKILLDYPSSLYSDRARKRYNALKAR
ncbi:MAG: hypothetical protein IJ745_03615 [Bacteroidales bacterium]|nr:hypothetical protein [Bacteroidales bacterium]